MAHSERGRPGRSETAAAAAAERVERGRRALADAALGPERRQAEGQLLLAETRLALRRGDRAAAAEAGRRARALFVAEGEGYRSYVTRLDGWLAAGPPR